MVVQSSPPTLCSLRIHSKRENPPSLSRPADMEDDFHKRNTDCVYFLASPLTCKKGVDCEYRHNELARLNPRECLFWLNEGCLNPTCAFRHPPLDGRPETASVFSSSHHQSAAPANKKNVLCHFYFNGHCYNGERCLYLHGPEDTTPKRISSKTASAAYDSEKKTSMCSDMGSAPVETQSFGFVSERVTRTKIKPKKAVCLTPGDNVAELSVSQQVSSPPLGEIAPIRSNSSIPEEASVRSPVLMGESSNDQDLDLIEREDWLESSPGFDVLVNDGSEDFIYENDAGYLLHQDVEDPETICDHLLLYDYKDKIEYDPAYPDLGVSFGREHNGFPYVGDDNIHNSVSYLPIYEKKRAPDCSFRQKRKPFQADLSSKCHSGVDLRDYLKKRRVIAGQYPAYPQIRERPAMLPRRHQQGRLASKIEFHSVGSRIGNETCLNGIYKPARYRAPGGRSRHHFRERRLIKRRNLLSEVSGKRSSRKRRSAENSGLFKGPKTLAQIKEEKRKAQENGDCSAR